jgi:acyl-CoA thioesterase FadM
MDRYAVPREDVVRFERVVAWGECDPAGVVYTPRFADYAVEAYHFFLGELIGRPLQKRLAEHGLGTPMKAMHFEFHRSLWPDEVFTIEVYVAGLRTRSFDLSLIARKADAEPAFSALLSPICIGDTARASIPIPDFLRTALEAYAAAFPAPS